MVVKRLLCDRFCMIVKELQMDLIVHTALGKHTFVKFKEAKQQLCQRLLVQSLASPLSFVDIYSAPDACQYCD
jgi:hypothetical protein